MRKFDAYLSEEASEKRIRELGPKLAERYRESLQFATPITWQSNPALLRLAAAYLGDPTNQYGMIDHAVSLAVVKEKAI
ncbi:MAG: hypothetical protein EOO77_17445 [Oxalobacteraceae bacterium]|nr:MAG: hypothetical protein EOO77_17445 [Oxalobacteraceae bacterium]